MYFLPSVLTTVFVLPSAIAAGAGPACCFKLVTSFWSSATCRFNSSIALASEDVCAATGCTARQIVAARLVPAVRINLLLNIGFSVGDVVLALFGDFFPVGVSRLKADCYSRMTNL